MVFTYDPEMTQQVMHIYQVIRSQIGDEAIKGPLWYCGLSEGQLAAANGLKRALGDDILQCSTHRSHRLLAKLGIVPRPPPSGLNRLLQMSRGNDVAFLWFLMEMYYKTTNHAVIYELNERIIMSAIFWLDLFPTLSELERVLPLPNESVAIRMKQDQVKVGRFKSSQTKLMNDLNKELAQIQSKSKHVHSPYFEKILLPIPRQRRHFVHRPKQPIPLPTVEPRSMHHSFKSRWFGKYTFNHSERVARSVLNKEVENILCKLKSKKRPSADLTSLCGHHKFINQMEQSLSDNLAMIKRDLYNRFLDVDFKRRENTRRRVLEDLDRMSERYLAEFRALAKKERVAAIRKRLIMDPCDPGFIYLSKDDIDRMEDDNLCRIIDSRLGIHLPDKCVPPSVVDNSPNELELKQVQECQCAQSCDEIRPRKDGQRGSELRWSDNGVEREKVQTQERSRRQCCCGSKYFELSPDAGFHKFNYRKLFDAFKDEEKEEQEQRIKSAIIKALKDDADELEEIPEDRKCEINTLVDRLVKRRFKEGTDLFEKEYQKAHWNSLKSDAANRIDLGYTYYDADDLDLMRDLLRRGLDRVAHDKRFVLPTLPEVHHVPLLLEWIRARYGKRYSQLECKRNYKQANVVMNNVMHMMKNNFVQMKRLRTMGLNGKATGFPAHNANRTILKKHWNKYSKQFYLSFLEMGRIFYSAMGGHQNTLTNKIYFTYMPSQFRDW
ncbi:uncharacterized protein LOC6574799 [Drosophila mojavensis]|uniref:DUF4771 domain-containing protein n=1 Tax=Drosophila mojavensis TaxID=7230 RepID=B4K6I8_DROMO|nr:uncharacterized protein LOC6574799 [Drosophila mojavensis]EDW16288.1 uncharacterized protein Dmoj_GI22311 [Drosophila mojavensis]